MADEQKPWSQCSTQELLDMAQAAWIRDVPKHAEILMQAAQVQAASEFVWTFQNQLIPQLVNQVWDSMRSNRG